ncbi:hypothetical protein BaRGS_00005944 [Batillaria attramentaria]|uniref:Uncharacterized protein n=1 Tax=Batillaria attramentaria TaxID=370345 RepID=A0ABD0LT12_9CAEN
MRGHSEHEDEQRTGDVAETDSHDQEPAKQIDYQCEAAFSDGSPMLPSNRSVSPKEPGNETADADSIAPVMANLSKGLAKKSRRGRNRDAILEMGIFGLGQKEIMPVTPPTEGSNLVRDQSPVRTTETERVEDSHVRPPDCAAAKSQLPIYRRRFSTSAARYRGKSCDQVREVTGVQMEAACESASENQTLSNSPTKTSSPRRQLCYSEKLGPLISMFEEKKNKSSHPLWPNTPASASRPITVSAEIPKSEDVVSNPSQEHTIKGAATGKPRDVPDAKKKTETKENNSSDDSNKTTTLPEKRKKLRRRSLTKRLSNPYSFKEFPYGDELVLSKTAGQSRSSESLSCVNNDEDKQTKGADVSTRLSTKEMAVDKTLLSFTVEKTLTWEQGPELEPVAAPPQQSSKPVRKIDTARGFSKETRENLTPQFPPESRNAPETPIDSCTSSPGAADDTTTRALTPAGSNLRSTSQAEECKDGGTVVTQRSPTPARRHYGVSEREEEKPVQIRPPNAVYSFKYRLQQLAGRYMSHSGSDSDSENSSPASPNSRFGFHQSQSPPKSFRRSLNSPASIPVAHEEDFTAERQNCDPLRKAPRLSSVSAGSVSSASPEICAVCNNDCSCSGSCSNLAGAAHSQGETSCTPGNCSAVASSSPAHLSSSDDSHSDNESGRHCDQNHLHADANEPAHEIKGDRNLSTSSDMQVQNRGQKKHPGQLPTHMQLQSSDADTDIEHEQDQSVNDSLINKAVSSTVAEALQLHTEEFPDVEHENAQTREGAQNGTGEGTTGFALSDFGLEDEDGNLSDMSGCLDPEHSDLDSDIDDL